jgi:hypothetical protein
MYTWNISETPQHAKRLQIRGDYLLYKCSLALKKTRAFLTEFVLLMEKCQTCAEQITGTIMVLTNLLNMIMFHQKLMYSALWRNIKLLDLSFFVEYLIIGKTSLTMLKNTAYSIYLPEQQLKLDFIPPHFSLCHLGKDFWQWNSRRVLIPGPSFSSSGPPMNFGFLRFAKYTHQQNAHHQICSVSYQKCWLVNEHNSDMCHATNSTWY